jgi:hypothetical protein
MEIADVFQGVYYHMDYVGDPRDYKWINTIQLEKTVEQVRSFNPLKLLLLMSI